MRGLISFITALLFGCVLLVMGYAALWFFAHQRLQGGVDDLLANISDGQARYASVSWGREPLETRLVLHDVVIPARLADGSQLALHLGDIALSNDIIGEFIFSFELARDIELVHRVKGQYQRFSLVVERGLIQYFPQIEGGEWHLSAFNLALRTPNGEPLIKLGDSYVVVNGRNGFRLNLHQLALARTNRPDITLETLATDFILPKHRALRANILSSWLQQDEARLAEVWAENLQSLRDTKRILLLESLTVREGELLLSTGGLIGADLALRPTGDLRISANDLDAVINTLLRLQIMDPAVVTTSRWLERLIRRSGLNKQIRLHAGDGQLRLNNVVVGELPPLAEFSDRVFQ